MAVCAYQDLIDEAVEKCYVSKSPRVLLIAETQMLCNLLDKIENPPGEITCDIDELLEQGNCFATLPDQILRAIKLQLLCEISEAL